MNGLVVLNAAGVSLAQAWENSVDTLYWFGQDMPTEYDKEGDPLGKDCTMFIVVMDPLSEPMFHLYNGANAGPIDFQEYEMEVLQGTKDHCIGKGFHYTYHDRLFAHDGLGGYALGIKVDQIENIVDKLVEATCSRRIQAITWIPLMDAESKNPPCLQRVWFRLTFDGTHWYLSMNADFRSNDAYKAALMNMYAMIRLQEWVAMEIARKTDGVIIPQLGRYLHKADSYHIYGSDLKTFKSQFLAALNARTFEQRTQRYDENAQYMQDAIPELLEKAKGMCNG